ncbi:polysaccharide deacetylase family protein [Gallaecimonas sp. GXIMD4217]|uniref:polysaccharide deacetylase family protein n=1 Tax=Gallaecimonas sp. GXIMD4217 TaxID=3131927 RepID=UPI00311B06EB
MWRWLLLCLCLPVMAAQQTVVLLYHHVAEDSPFSTSTRPDDFRAHLEHLKQGGFTVVPLSQAIAAAKGEAQVPDKAVAITFDDGYRDIAENAAPLLAQYGYPYTLFVNPASLGAPGMMSRADLAELAQQGATIANHGWGHPHLTELPLDRAKAAILDAQQALPASPRWLAWPYGEYNGELQAFLRAEGYVAFGQQSGPMGPGSDLTALPRFPAAGHYADLASLKLKLNTLHLPVASSDTEMLRVNGYSPALTLTVKAEDADMGRFNCFFEGQVLDLAIQGQQAQVPALDLPPGRSRVNCTAPSKDQPGRFYWWSQPWLSPKAQ